MTLYFCFLLLVSSRPYFGYGSRIRGLGTDGKNQLLKLEYFGQSGRCRQHVISHQVNPSPMTVRLRLAVHGVRHNRIFHLVAVNQRKRRNAKPIELLGVYRPRVEPQSPHKSVEWSVDRIKYWLGVGAQPSDSVVKLLTKVRPVCMS